MAIMTLAAQRLPSQSIIGEYYEIVEVDSNQDEVFAGEFTNASITLGNYTIYNSGTSNTWDGFVYRLNDSSFAWAYSVDGTVQSIEMSDNGDTYVVIQSKLPE